MGVCAVIWEVSSRFQDNQHTCLLFYRQHHSEAQIFWLTKVSARLEESRVGSFSLWLMPHILVLQLLISHSHGLTCAD